MSESEEEPEVAEAEEAASDEPDKDGAKAPDGPSEFVQSLASPISAGEPCGESVRYDDDFETIKSEYGKLSDFDYEMIKELSTGLLLEKTKDILVGSYLAVALYKTDGLKGLAEGISLLDILSTTFWDDLLPKKMAARSSAISFFVQKTHDDLEVYKPTLADGETLELIGARIKGFQTFTMESMAEHAPPLSGFVKLIDALKRKVPKAAAPKPVAGAQADASGTAPAAGGGAPAAAGGAPGTIASISDAERAIRAGSMYFHENDWKDPVAYRVIRSLQWGQITSLPQTEGSQTMIPDPEEHRLFFLKNLLSKSEYQNLLEACEAMFAEDGFLFVLDLQRMASIALEQMGSDFEPARMAVLEETALLLNRLPGLRNLTFSDGTPFSSPMCEDWIQAEVAPLLGSSGGGGGAGSAIDSGDEQFEKSKKEAQKLLQKGDLQKAIKLIRADGDSDKSSKQRFLRQLFLADLCIKGERPAIARAILEKLDALIDQHSLAEWDPDLALSALSSLRACYVGLIPNAAPPVQEELSRQSDNVFEKICQIDAAYALSLP